MNKTEGKPCYEAYATRAFRFYTRTPERNGRLCDLSQADAASYAACNETMLSIDVLSQEIVSSVYRMKAPITDAVANTARQFRIPESRVWHCLRRANRIFAEKRGLI